MEIKVNAEAWAVVDLLTLPTLAQIEDLEKSVKENFKINLDKRIISLVEKVKKALDFNDPLLKLFFNKDSELLLLNWDIEDLAGLDKPGQLPDYFLNIDRGEMVSRALTHLGADPHLLSNRKELSGDEIYRFVRELEVSEEEKWSVFSFLKDPDSSFKKMAEYSKLLIATVMGDLHKLGEDISSFNKSVTEELKSRGADGFRDLFKTFGLEGCDEIHIILSSFAQTLTLFSSGNRTAYVQAGREYGKILNSSSLYKLEDSAKLVNAISEPVKFSIIKCLKGKKLYGREICDRTGLSKTALSYHLDSLHVLNIINMEKSGTRIYYSLDLETIGKVLNAFMDYFKS